ncbi:hypothetical protein EMCG_01641 [[Emmonsia] crescens]|uniref:DUF4219 domain-containing protein n=1 Tax=[Emmonsia] crescens TaxID=73230 RepID=A0A0G2I0E2_9EURO|nr:hypothetical protein EMCG_01641 [Emmonsia crescens UAMH 3008]
MADPSDSRCITRSRSASSTSTARDRPPGAFESSINDPSNCPDTPPQQSHAGLTTAPPTIRPSRGKQRAVPPLNNDEEDEEALELQVQLARLQASNPDIPSSAPRNAPWNPDMGGILNYALYDPDSRAGKAIAQFKQDTKNIGKPNALTGTANYVTWRAAMKAKIIDAQCWVIIEREQYEDPLGSPEWARPFGMQRIDGCMPSFNSLSATVRINIICEDDDRIAYALWDVLENEYSIPKT